MPKEKRHYFCPEMHMYFHWYRDTLVLKKLSLSSIHQSFSQMSLYRVTWTAVTELTIMENDWLKYGNKILVMFSSSCDDVMTPKCFWVSGA